MSQRRERAKPAPMNRLDKAISYLAPGVAAKRIRARMHMRLLDDVRAYYDGADVGRRGASIRRSNAAPEIIAARTLPRLITGSHDLIRNNPHARRGCEAIVSNVFGAGIVPRFKRGKTTVNRLQKLARQTLDTTSIDYNGQLDYYGLQALIGQTVVESGSCLIRRWFVDDAFPIRFQVLEPDFLDVARDGLLPNGGRIVQGVQFDATGRREGYWLHTEHPGGRLRTVQSVFVAARNIAHVYRIERPGQVHGIPWLAPVMLQVAEFSDYQDAQLLRQKIAACFAVVKEDSVNALPGQQSSEERDLEQIEPGMIIRTQPGSKITFGTPPIVNDYADFAKVSVRAIAAGLGITHEALSGDLENVNFTSGRMGRLEMERNVDRWRWHTFIPMGCEVMVGWWLDGAALTGANVRNVEVRHTPPAKEMISPEREVPSKVNAMKSGQKTLTQILQESGRDVDEHLDEMAEERRMLEERGIALDFVNGASPNITEGPTNE